MFQRKSTLRPSSRRVRRYSGRRKLPLFLIPLVAVLAAGALLFSGFGPWQQVSSPPSLPSADDGGSSDSQTVPLQAETEEPEEDPWNLILVNPWNPMPEGYDFTLRELPNGHAVDERCYDALVDMLDACEEEGLSPLICSSYRTQEKQESLFQNKIDRLIAQGYSQEDAEVEAAKSVAVPGTSEHQLGLAVDIVDVNNQNLDRSQEDTAVQKWLMEHSWEYGFILRYPNEKSAVTGIIYEPWHYRYVGRDVAKEIYDLGVCLEEYLDSNT